HLVLGLFLVIFAEELGIPLPAPGDATITYGGYQTTTGAIPYPLAYVAVVAGATLGSFCLYTLSRRFGHPFFVRFGPISAFMPTVSRGQKPPSSAGDRGQSFWGVTSPASASSCPRLPAPSSFRVACSSSVSSSRHRS